MKLSILLSSHFESHVRSRGTGYYRSGSVRIKSGSESAVEARVHGARQYYVEMTLGGRQLNLRCSCPYFESTGPCKHLWATVLAAEAQGHLSAVTGATGNLVVNDDLEEDEDAALFETEVDDYRRPVRPLIPPPQPRAAKPPEPGWRDRLRQVTATAEPATNEHWPASRQLLYIVNVNASITQGCLVISLIAREPKRAGGWKKPTEPRLTRRMIQQLPDPADRHILGLLAGASSYESWTSSWHHELPGSFRVTHPLLLTLMPLVAATGRCFMEVEAEAPPLIWDDGEPWHFELSLGRTDVSQWAVRGLLRRGDEEMGLKTPVLLVPGGLVFTRGRVARLAADTRFEWLEYLRRTDRIEIPQDEAQAVLAELLNHPVPAQVQVPEELRYEEVRGTPRPCLTVRALELGRWEKQPRMVAELAFEYDGQRVADDAQGRGLYDPQTRRLTVRDLAARKRPAIALRNWA